MRRVIDSCVLVPVAAVSWGNDYIIKKLSGSGWVKSCPHRRSFWVLRITFPIDKQLKSLALCPDPGSSEGRSETLVQVLRQLCRCHIGQFF